MSWDVDSQTAITPIQISQGILGHGTRRGGKELSKSREPGKKLHLVSLGCGCCHAPHGGLCSSNTVIALVSEWLVLVPQAERAHNGPRLKAGDVTEYSKVRRLASTTIPLAVATFQPWLELNFTPRVLVLLSQLSHPTP